MKLKTFLLSPVLAAVVSVAAAVPPALLAQQSAQPSAQTVAQFQKIEDLWSTALVNQNQFKLETILAPSFTAISANGQTITRNQRVARLFEKGTPQVVSLVQRVTGVRIIEDVAVVDGTYTERTSLNGVERAEHGVFTHIYQQDNGNWHCVQSQRTPLPIATEQAKSKTNHAKDTQAKNDKGHGFHLPL